MQKWRIAAAAELQSKRSLEFRVGDGDWPFRGFLVWWNDEAHAYANFCPHAGHPLNISPDRFFTPDGAQLICSSHGALFDPGSGKCTQGPCAGDQLMALTCSIEDGEVWVEAPASQRDM